MTSGLRRGGRFPFDTPEPDGVTRKKALLRILALREAERRAVFVGDAELVEYSSRFRGAFRMVDDSDLDAWLVLVGLSRLRFESLLREFATILKLEQALAVEIDGRVDEQATMWTARRWAQSKGES